MRRIALLLAVLMLSGCAARPRIMPSEALDAALAHPVVAAWQAEHSAPTVLEGLPQAAIRGLGDYKPVAMVDLVAEGLMVRLDSALGPRPRRVEVIVDGESGVVREVKQR